MIEVLQHQPRARISLEAALRDDTRSRTPTFHGPRAAGKRRGRARVRGGVDLGRRGRSEDAARRVLSGVHPDLTWVEPRGAHDILVDDVRTHIVRQAALRPFESRRRVFVIVDADR